MSEVSQQPCVPATPQETDVTSSSNDQRNLCLSASVAKHSASNHASSMIGARELRVHANYALKNRNGFGLASRATQLVAPRTQDELRAAIEWCALTESRIRVLGSGSNSLFSQREVDGLTVVLDSPEFKRIVFAHRTVFVGAGATLASLVRACARRGLTGLEPLSGIPGTVGAAVVGNSGSYGVAFADVCSHVTVVNTSDGSVQRVPRSAYSCDYRSCSLTNCIILSAELNLQLSNTISVRDRCRATLQKKSVSQPLGTRSLGCIFVNPPTEFTAGQLIDHCGFRGKRFGTVQVSIKHANFLVSSSPAPVRFDDIADAIRTIRTGVLREHGLSLSLEVQVW